MTSPWGIAAGGGPCVAVDIRDPVLRRRVENDLRALAAEAVLVIGDAADADVIIADRPLEALAPAVLVGPSASSAGSGEDGIMGRLPPAFTREQLRIAVEAAVHGLVCLPAKRLRSSALSRHGDGLDDFTGSGIGTGGSAALSDREAEVLDLLMTGASNKQIARALDISVHTAKFHVGSIIGKLGARTRTDAVARALKLQQRAVI